MNLKTLFLLLLPCFAFGQRTDTLRLKMCYERAIDAERIELDRLGQVYVYAKGGWTKYDNTGKDAGRFTEYGMSSDDVWDVSDPQKILYYQPAFQKGVVMDRTMNPDFTFDFNTQDGTSSRYINFVATSSDSKLWASDFYNNTILKLDKNGNNILKNNFLDRNNAISLQPQQLLETDNNLYVYVPEAGILVYDAFGMLLRTLLIKNLQNFNVINGQIIACDKQKIHTFDHKTGIELKSSVLPISDIQQVRCEKGKIAVLLPHKVQVFDIL